MYSRQKKVVCNSRSCHCTIELDVTYTQRSQCWEGWQRASRGGSQQAEAWIVSNSNQRPCLVVARVRHGFENEKQQEASILQKGSYIYLNGWFPESGVSFQVQDDLNYLLNTDQQESTISDNHRENEECLIQKPFWQFHYMSQ